MKLTLQQQEAIAHYRGPALVLAVPGAGKTTVLLNRILGLVRDQKVEPKHILSITFSKSQAIDMKRRYELMTADSAHKSSPTFSTIHAFSYDIVRTHDRENGIHRSLIEGNSGYNKYALIKSLYYRMHGSYISDDSLEEFFTSLSFMKNRIMDMEGYLKTNRTGVKGFRQLVSEYETFKKSKHLLDFDDMLTVSLEIVNSDPKLLKRIKNAYRFVQVDEGQDTSKIQMELIKKISFPENNLFIVADDDQSIYGFRGAMPDELLRFKDAYPDGKVFFMEENHRSYRDIVLVSNQFIKSNMNRYEKNVYTAKEKIKPISLITCKNMEVELSFLIDRIGEERSLNPESSIAVLYRNNVSGMALTHTMTCAGIPHYLRDVKRTYLSHFVIEDILNILMLSREPSSLDLYEKIYYKLNAYLKKEYLLYLQGISYSDNIFDRLLDIKTLSDYQVDRIIQLKHSINRISKMDISKGIEYIVDTLGYGAYLEERIRRSGSGGDSADIIIESLKHISKGMTSPTQLAGVLTELKEKRYDFADDSIILSTIHSSKGLEYDTVFVIDLIEGEFPSDKIATDSSTDSGSMEEERRLFYVAMTRAKSSLTLISLKNRNNLKVKPSRFFNEVRRMKQKKSD